MNKFQVLKAKFTFGCPTASTSPLAPATANYVQRARTISWPAAVEKARANSQQPSKPFANLNIFPEANKTEPTEPLFSDAASSVSQPPFATHSPKMPKEIHTPSIFDQPLPASPSPSSNPFSKLTSTRKSAPATSVLNDSSPSGSAFSNPFALVDASHTPLQNSKPHFRNSMKIADEKVTAADKTLSSSLTVKGKFHVPGSASYEFTPEKQQGDGKGVEVAAAENVVEVAALTPTPTATTAENEVVGNAEPLAALEESQTAVVVQTKTVDDVVAACAATAAPEDVEVVDAQSSVTNEAPQTAVDFKIDTHEDKFEDFSNHNDLVPDEQLAHCECSPPGSAVSAADVPENTLKFDTNDGAHNAHEYFAPQDCNDSFSVAQRSRLVADPSDHISEIVEDYDTMAANKPLAVCEDDVSALVEVVAPDVPSDLNADKFDPEVMSPYEWLTMRGREALATVSPEDLHLVHYVMPIVHKDLDAPGICDAADSFELENDNTNANERLATCDSEPSITHDEPQSSDVLEIVQDLQYEDDFLTRDVDVAEVPHVAEVAEDLQNEDEASLGGAVAYEQLPAYNQNISTTDDEPQSSDITDAAEIFKYEDDANYSSRSAYEQLAALDYDTSTTNDEPQSPIDGVFDCGYSSEGTCATSPGLDIDPEAGTWVEYEPIQDASTVLITHHRLSEVECTDDEQVGPAVR